MKQATITPSKLKGEVTVPPSKSMAHRAIICACLAKGKSVIDNIDFSDDIESTIENMRAMGADIQVDGNKLYIDGKNTFSAEKATLDCRESGSTLRFLLPVASVGGIDATFTGRGRLPERTIGEIVSQMKNHGIESDREDGLPINNKGKLTGGEYYLSGSISSQFVSGLLFALPLCEEDSVIYLTTPLQSKSYVDITIYALKKFGIEITQEDDKYIVKGNQKYRPKDMKVEGDWSQAAFFLVADALGNNILVKGMDENSLQGDKAIYDILKKCGCSFKNDSNGIICEANKLSAFEVDATNIPDIVPILAVLGTFCEGTSVIKGAARLRLKESDRLLAISENLNALGGNIEQTEDGLIINGCNGLTGGKVKGFNDHRIVMSMAVASTKSFGKVAIDDAQSIRKSYPSFFEDFNNIGGKANVIDLG